MSEGFKPSKEKEDRYDKEAERYRQYITGSELWWNKGDEKFADTASVPLMKKLDKEFALQGEK